MGTTEYAIFLYDSKVFGVTFLTDCFRQIIDPDTLPVLVETVLLPFKKQIICDENMIITHRVSLYTKVIDTLNQGYQIAKDKFGIITTLPYDEYFENPCGENVEDDVLDTLILDLLNRRKTDLPIPILLTKSQRCAVAGILPQFKPKLELNHPRGKTIYLTCQEIESIIQACQKTIPELKNGMLKNSLSLAFDTANKTLKRHEGRGIFLIPRKSQVFQVRISVKDIEPEIWRRIQIKDCTLDRFHRYIQAAMGWQGYHHYRFKIKGIIYGLRHLIEVGWEFSDIIVDASKTKLSDVIPKDGSQFTFCYQYVLTKKRKWCLEVIFERCLQAESEERYPICLHGKRACPPDNVGGVSGYERYLRILNDPENQEYERCLQWRGPFDSEAFDAERTTKKMRREK